MPLRSGEAWGGQGVAQARQGRAGSRREGQEAEGKEEVIHAKQRAWLQKMRQFKFVAHCLLMLDQDTALRVFSKSTQSDQAYALDVPNYKEQLQLELQRFHAGVLGPEISKNLAQLKKGEFAGVPLLNVPGKEEELVVVGLEAREVGEGLAHPSDLLVDE